MVDKLATSDGRKKSKPAEERKNTDETGFLPGGLLWAHYKRDDSWRMADVIDRKPRPGTAGNAHPWVYYVHYHNVNRRMDEWVHWPRLRAVNANAHTDLFDAAEAAATGATVKADRRDAAQTVMEMEMSGTAMQGEVEFVEEKHGDEDGMDEASLLEHEQVTKVKNVAAVELGKYLVETWYFSPFPKECVCGG